MVRGEPPARGRRDARVGASFGLGGARVVADRGRRTPRHPGDGGAVRHHAVREAPRAGPRRPVVPGVGLREPDRPAGRQRRLHGDAHRRAAASGATSPSRGSTRTSSSSSPAAARGCTTSRGSARRCGPGERVRIDDATPRSFCLGLWGPARPRHPAGRSPTTTSRTRPSRYLRGAPVDVGRGAAVRAADQLRRRARLGAVRADGAGRAALGRPVGGRARARPDRRRPRRVRLAAAREGLPPVGPGHPHRARPVRGRARVRGAARTRTTRAGRPSTRRASPPSGWPA